MSLPPVYSPVPVDAVWAGLAAALRRKSTADPHIASFLRERYGARSFLLMDSGTNALALAMRAVAAETGDRPIAIPAYSCFDVATAVEAAGVRALLYDLDPATLGPDWESLRRALDRGASAVLVAHLYGVPVDMSAVRALAGEYGAILIEDAAQGSGAEFDGVSIGSFGSLGIVSFGRGKGVTGGEGGALFSCDDAGEELFEGISSALDPGRSGVSAAMSVGAAWLLARPGLYSVPAALPFLHLGETLYREPTRPSAMSSAARDILARAIPGVPAEESTRRQNAKRLAQAVEAFSSLEQVRVRPGARAGYLRFPLLAASEGAAARARGPAARRLGIMPGYPRPLAELSRFRPLVANADEAFAGSDRLVGGLLTLPTHGRLEPRHLARLERWILATDS